MYLLYFEKFIILLNVIVGHTLSTYKKVCCKTVYCVTPAASSLIHLCLLSPDFIIFSCASLDFMLVCTVTCCTDLSLGIVGYTM